MSARAVHLVIDARPRGPHGPLAAEVVLGKSVLDHLLDLAAEHVPPGKAVVVHARGDEHEWLRELVARFHEPTRIVFVNGPPRADAAILRTDRLYDPARLRRGLRRGRSPESAVIWRLDRPESLSTADQELTRRLSYQPLGKYWAFPLARATGGATLPDIDHAQRRDACFRSVDALAAAISSLPVLAAGSAGRSSRCRWRWRWCLTPPTAASPGCREPARPLAGGSTRSLDELADMALHAAIAWAAFSRDGSPLWLVLGIIYASGKYLFLVQSLLGDELEKRDNPHTTLTSAAGSGSESAQPKRVARPDLTAARSSARPCRRSVASLDRTGISRAGSTSPWRLTPSTSRLRALAGAVRKGVRYA